MENSALERLYSIIKARLEGISDEMDPQLAQQFGTFVANAIKDEVKASILSDPRVASRMAGLRASTGAQMDAVKAHLDQIRDEMVSNILHPHCTFNSNS
jgi:hypothetical protein